ncbi:MAG: AMP-binding protein [Verrucomicrobia bacterium]|nr:AMP-binding protein [Verrucomicrobiota bacterium]
MTTIAEILSGQARARPDTLALVEARPTGGRRLTFGELEREVERAAAELAAWGLHRGDAVLVFVPMSVDLYVSLLAMFRLGVVALFLDPSAGRRHLEQCCQRWPPRALLATRRAHLLRLVCPALQRIPLKLIPSGWWPNTRCWPGWSRRPGAPARHPASLPARGDVRPEDPALVTFTSGSTGGPKAAVRTHGFLVAQHRVLAPAIGLAAGDVDLGTLPIFTLANLASGVTTVLSATELRRPGAVDGAQVMEEIGRHRVNRIAASPAFFERLVAAARAGGAVLTTLRHVHTGGAPVFPRVLADLRAVAPQAEVVAVYGSTEAEPIAHLAAEEITEDDLAAMRSGGGLLAGQPVEAIDLRIVRDRWGTPRGALGAAEFAAETLPTGEVGEIVVAGEHVLPGYLGGVGDEETKFRVDGRVWHRTGDAGRIDDRGRLWLLGRCAARIDDARGRLYPFAVECVAMEISGVRRAAAIAHRDRRLLVVEAPTECLDSLRAALVWAHLDEVRMVRAIPVDRRHNAKIDYPALRRMLG